MDIKNSIVAILHSSGKIVGTGFLVSQDLVVTCAHVIIAADAIDGETVQVCFHEQKDKLNALVLPEYWRDVDKEDLAVLRLESVPERVAPLPLGNAIGSEGHDFYAYGYGTVTGLQGIGARGQIIDVIQAKSFVQVESPQLDYGMSGAPVWDTARRVVVGLVTKGKSAPDAQQNFRNIFTTLATSVETLRSVCPRLGLQEICPYRSLGVFTEADAPYFFGRKSFVERLIDNLSRGTRLLIVRGPSGSGKSSVVRAGLLPALRKGQIPGSQNWESLTLRPASQPFEQLARLGWVDPQAGLEQSARNWLATRPTKPEHLVLVIDQFEELLTITPARVRQAFITALVQLLNSPLALTVIITIRDDFYTQFLQEAQEFSELFTRDPVDIPNQLERGELAEMIEGPAQKVGLTLDPGLVETLLADLASPKLPAGAADSQSLPLLEFALTQLWELRTENRLSLAVYQALGRTTGALTHWADQVYYTVALEQRSQVERIFCSLVHVGNVEESIPDTRRAVLLDELIPDGPDSDLRPLIDKLVEARLLATHSEYGPNQTARELVEIVHDTLLTRWDSLRRWLNQDRPFLVWKQKIVERQADWRRGQMDLLSGSALTLALNYLGTRGQDLLEVRDYIEKSARRARQKRFLLFGSGVAVLAVIIGILLFSNSQIAQERDQTLARQLIAQGQLELNRTDLGPFYSTLLGIKSLQIAPSLGADQVIRAGLALLPHSQVCLPSGGFPASHLVFSPDGQFAAGATLDQTLHVWKLASAQEKFHAAVGSDITALAFSGDGQFLAAGSADGRIQVWEIASGQVVTQLAQGSQVLALAFVTDQSHLATVGADATVKYWDTTRQTASSFLLGETVGRVLFSRDGQLVAASDNKNVKVWRVANGEFVHRVIHDDVVTDFDFSPDGIFLATGGLDHTIAVWKIATGEELAYMAHDKPITDLEFNGDGTQIVSGSADCTARVWDVATWKELARIDQGHPVTTVAFSPNGRWAAALGENGFGKAWNAATGQELARFQAGDAGQELAFSPLGRWLLIGGQPACLLEIASPVEDDRWQNGEETSSLAVNPAAPIAVSGAADGVIRFWNLVTGQEIARQQHRNGIEALVYSQAGERIVSGSRDGAVQVWDGQTGEAVAAFQLEDGAKLTNVTLSPDGQRIMSSGLDNTVRVWEIATNAPLAEFKVKRSNEAKKHLLAFDPLGQFVAVNGGDNLIRLWNLELNDWGFAFEHDQPLRSIQFSADGKWILSTAQDGTVRIWELARNKEIKRMEQGGSVNTAIFSPDGKLVASASDNGTVKIWADNGGETGSWDLVATLEHFSPVTTVAFSPDGAWIVSGSADGTSQVWNLATETEMARFQHPGNVTAVAFSADSRWVVSRDGTGHVEQWLWRSTDLLEQACRSLPRNLTLDEWGYYMGSTAYQVICADLPVPTSAHFALNLAARKLRANAWVLSALALLTLALLGLGFVLWRHKIGSQRKWIPWALSALLVGVWVAGIYGASLARTQIRQGRITPNLSGVTGAYWCDDLDLTKLVQGARGRVALSLVNLRSAPVVPDAFHDNIVLTMNSGDRLTVIGGPQCAHNGTWWQVRMDTGQTGWVREYLQAGYLVEPIQ